MQKQSVTNTISVMSIMFLPLFVVITAVFYQLFYYTMVRNASGVF